MLLMIDNYDSFTYNIVQYLGILGQQVTVYRNDELTVARLLELQPDRLVISPGPCTPKEAGISVAAITALAGKIPILGICLGHQAIGAAFGGHVVRAGRVMHGKTSLIGHHGKELFAGIDNPFEATRYHSLVIERHSLPSCLEITAWATDDQEIMGVRHRELPVWGIQFHPESILTKAGMQILDNFLHLAP
ncbi:MAG: aminodeoxychorismate/anthranilate synthase component II [Deltaproteobacteria bacterium]|nr:aminodeoxychorismate/anthranilate synthase component II [Candidatus Anaeroferrophillus wilburensis]MBN2888868.1 aminodeoxychorismate/anthranilate synthase component II [Deltaproteobacteria bacterium]